MTAEQTATEAPSRRYVVRCSTCKAPIAGLLAACPRPVCLAIATADEARADRLAES
jgi:hypothetical protein